MKEQSNNDGLTDKEAQLLMYFISPTLAIPYNR